MRSVATSRSWSPRSKRSRTLPWRSGRVPFRSVSRSGSVSGTVVWRRKGGILATAVHRRNRTQGDRLSLVGALIYCGGSERDNPVHPSVKHRTALVSLLALALLVWFFRHANFSEVWQQVRHAR